MMNANYRTDERHPAIYLAIAIALGLVCAAASCKKPEQSKIYTMQDSIKAPVVLDKPLPAYTEEARKARAQGNLILQAVVRKNGSVDSFKVMKPLGYGLDESAINTIKTRWRFSPGTLDGKPVDVLANFDINFKLY